MNFSVKKYFYSLVLFVVFLGIQSFNIVHECKNHELSEISDCDWCKNLNNVIPLNDIKFDSFENICLKEFKELFFVQAPIVFLGPIDNKGPPLI